MSNSIFIRNEPRKVGLQGEFTKALLAEFAENRLNRKGRRKKDKTRRKKWK